MNDTPNTITGKLSHVGIQLQDKHQRKKIEFRITQDNKHKDEALFVAYEGVVDYVLSLNEGDTVDVSFKTRSWMSGSGYWNTTLTAIHVKKS
jgi:hypothetical protein